LTRNERLAFRVEFSELAADEFRKLDKPVRDRIARKLQAVALSPARFLTRLTSVEAYKLRVGDYRAIVDVDWPEKLIYVLSVGHRSTVYR
jgi:mRNA interferase RelE/StbE